MRSDPEAAAEASRLLMEVSGARSADELTVFAPTALIRSDSSPLERHPNSESTTVLLGGKVWRSSIGLVLRPSRVIEEDSYGIGTMGQFVSGVARQLDDALTNGPMPARLLEALNSLREARMADHWDVHFYGVRPVTPRVATVLEDHAMELFASALNVRAESLAATIYSEELPTFASRCWTKTQTRSCIELIGGRFSTECGRLVTRTDATFVQRDVL